MKKSILILAVLIAISVPAAASDFTIGGQARYEAVDYDPGQGEDSEYFDQRFRVAFNWKVNDNVSTQLRADFAEFRWGDSYRPDPGSSDTIMVDRAWVKINQGPLTLTVGQQWGALGHGMIWSDQFQGIIAKLDFAPFGLNLVYAKEDEGADVTDESGTANDDTDIYAANLTFANDMFSGGLVVAFSNMDTSNAGEQKGYSAYFTAPIANFTLKGAIAAFGGDDNAGTDYEGTQFFITADTALTEALKVGLTFVWADDVDSGHTQITSIQEDDEFNPLDFGGAMAVNNYLTGVFVVNNGVFEPEANNGVVGIIGSAQYTVNDTLTVWAKLAYLEPNDSDGVLDSMTIAIVNLDWVWMPSVTVSAGIGYQSPEYDDNTVDDSAMLTTTQLTVAF
jgi:hypothetical protein